MTKATSNRDDLERALERARATLAEMQAALRDIQAHLEWPTGLSVFSKGGYAAIQLSASQPLLRSATTM